MSKIGIFGGSFDPVHYGHLGLAEDAMREAGLAKVLFVPAGQQPFKLKDNVTSGRDRLQMLKLAVEDQGLMEGKNFEISTYELDSESISYTYLTMRHMQQMLGTDAELYFITGTDTFLKVELWKNAFEILSKYSFIIGTRPGYKMAELEECINRVSSRYGTEIRLIHNKELDISSTEIRNKLNKGELDSGIIPVRVKQYIVEHELYRVKKQD